MDNRITLNDQYGREVLFEFLDLVMYEENEYVVLLQEGSEGEVTILLVEENDNDISSYASVEDEETLMNVFGIFKNRFKNEFDFADE